MQGPARGAPAGAGVQVARVQLRGRARRARQAGQACDRGVQAAQAARLRTRGRHDALRDAGRNACRAWRSSVHVLHVQRVA